MLKLNTDKKKSLDFDVSIQGIDHAELKGSLKFTIEGIEYGFPVEILKDNISVVVPPLQDVVKQGLKDGYVTDCKLEVFGNDFYLNPWSEQFQIKNEVKIEATIKLNEDEEVKVPTVVVNESPAIDLEDETPLSEEEADAGNELLERLLGKYKNIKPKKRTAVKESSSSSTGNKFDNIINEILDGKSPVRKKKKVVPKKKVVKEKKVVRKAPATTDDPIVFMESVGMTNPKSQKIMLQKAIDLGGDDNRAIMSTLQKMLLPQTQNPIQDFQKTFGK